MIQCITVPLHIYDLADYSKILSNFNLGVFILFLWFPITITIVIAVIVTVIVFLITALRSPDAESWHPGSWYPKTRRV